MGLASLAAVASILFASQVEAFHDSCDAPAQQVITRGSDTAFLVQPGHHSRAASHKIEAMSLLSLKLFHKGAAVGANPFAIVYDTRFGTDAVTAAATGWFTFALKSGCRRIWVDSILGSDSNDGLTAATAKQTLRAAAAVFVGSGYTPGDQLMVAGKGGRSYTDIVTGATGINAYSVDGRSGYSLAYPTAQLSYDPTDAANAAKYGKLVGNDMPVLNVDTNNALTTFSSSAGTGDNVVIQGFEYNSGGLNACSTGFSGVHNGIAVQNCRFNGVQYSAGNNNSNPVSTFNVSKCSFRGQWNTSGNAQGVFTAGTKDFWLQDSVFIHCGWKVGVTRDEPPATGGPYYLGHGDYLMAIGVGSNRVDRCVYADSAADGFNVRRSATATQIVSIDDAIGGTMGNFSGDYTEAPNGITITVDDWVIMGGADTSSSLPRGTGPQQRNTLSGSYVRKLAMFDNPKYGQIGNAMFTGFAQDANEVDSYMLYDKVHAYGYSPTAYAPSGVTSKVHTTWTNCLSDTVLTGGTNTTATLASFPNYKTKMQVLSALGFSTKGAALDAMFFTPHLPWAQAIHAIAMPSMGLTPSFTTVSPPSLAGFTIPQVYPTDETAPVLSLPTQVTASSTSRTIGVTTDEGNGKISWVVCTDSRTPDPDNMYNGQDINFATAAASGKITVSSSGAKTVTATGLTTGTTYYAFFMHDDAAGNRSNIVRSTSFVP